MRVTKTQSELILDFDVHASARSPHALRILAMALSGVSGVSSVRLTWRGAPQIVAVHDGDQAPADFLRHASALLRDPRIDFDKVSTEPISNTLVLNVQFPRVAMLEHGPEGRPESSQPSEFGTLTRILYGGLAGASFVMSWIGLAVPGIPTVPFVMLTVFFAERTSPVFSRCLCSSPVIGPIMCDWKAHHAIRRSSQIKGLVFMGALVLITVVLAQPSLPLYVFMSLMITLSVYMILRIPVIPEGTRDLTDLPAPVQLRLVGA